MYSLISAPVLGFDLARLDGGVATAELLSALLAVPVDDWSAVGGALPRESHARVAARARAEAAADTRPSVADLGGNPESAIALLHRAPIGTLTGLLHCVRSDVLGSDQDDRPGAPLPPEAVVTMAADAVCAAYLRELLSDRDRRLLAAGWLRARRRLPVRQADLGPQAEAVRRLLSTVRALRPRELRALSDAAERMRSAGSGDWSAAMHSATWAVHLSGRVRAAATGQFHLVQAVDLAAIPVADRAGGVWNVLSGAVQALMVRDLADTDSVLELLTPVLSALGPGWLLQL